MSNTSEARPDRLFRPRSVRRDDFVHLWVGNIDRDRMPSEIAWSDAMLFEVAQHPQAVNLVVDALADDAFKHPVAYLMGRAGAEFGWVLRLGVKAYWKDTAAVFLLLEAFSDMTGLPPVIDVNFDDIHLCNYLSTYGLRCREMCKLGVYRFTQEKFLSSALLVDMESDTHIACV